VNVKEYQLFENTLLWGITADKFSYCQEGISELKTSLFSKRRREPSHPASVSSFVKANWKFFGENGKCKKSICVYRILTSSLLPE
jgi:hypothetical protein